MEAPERGRPAIADAETESVTANELRSHMGRDIAKALFNLKAQVLSGPVLAEEGICEEDCFTDVVSGHEAGPVVRGPDEQDFGIDADLAVGEGGFGGAGILAGGARACHEDVIGVRSGGDSYSRRLAGFALAGQQLR